MRLLLVLYFCLSALLPALCQSNVFRQTGAASYYADKFQGRRTACGEKYYHRKYTAAHLTLPLGTVVKVTNLINGKSVVVRINDRGPYTQKFCIDLSKSAAKVLKIIGDSNNEVLIETELDSTNQPVLTHMPPKANSIDSVWFQEHFLNNKNFFDLTAKEVKPVGYGYKLYDYKELNYTLYLARKIGRYIAGDSVYIQPIFSNKANLEYTIWVGNYVSPKQAARFKRQLLKFGIRKPLLRKYP